MGIEFDRKKKLRMKFEKKNLKMIVDKINSN
jgi:hypothetical protein